MIIDRKIFFPNFFIFFFWGGGGTCPPCPHLQRLWTGIWCIVPRTAMMMSASQHCMSVRNGMISSMMIILSRLPTSRLMHSRAFTRVYFITRINFYIHSQSETRKPSWRKGYARQRRHSKMAVSRHLGYYRTGNSANRSADPDNHNLEPNMEWIECTVCVTFAFKFVLKLGFKVIESGTIWSSAYDFIFVFHSNYASIYYCFRDIAAYWSKTATPPPCIWRPVGVKPQIWAKDPWWRKTRMMGLSEGEIILMMRSAVLTQITRVTDRRTDMTDRRTYGITYIHTYMFICTKSMQNTKCEQNHRIGVAYTRYSMLSSVKNGRILCSAIMLYKRSNSK